MASSSFSLMQKTVAIALLPFLALGRGDLSGKSSENAATTQLFTTANYEMNLHLWNVKEGSIWKIVGDLEMKFTDVGKAIGGGVCIGFPPIVEVETVVEAEPETAAEGETKTETTDDGGRLRALAEDEKFDCLQFGM